MAESIRSLILMFCATTELLRNGKQPRIILLQDSPEQGIALFRLPCQPIGGAANIKAIQKGHCRNPPCRSLHMNLSAPTRHCNATFTSTMQLGTYLTRRIHTLAHCNKNTLHVEEVVKELDLAELGESYRLNTKGVEPNSFHRFHAPSLFSLTRAKLRAL